VLAAGTLAQASFSASSVGLPALGPALKSHYGLSLGETGVVLAGIGIGMLFTLLPWGLVADRVDERWVIATGLTGAAAMLAVTSTTQSFGAVTVALVLGGALAAATLPALAAAGGTRLAFLFLAGATVTGAIVAAVFVRSRMNEEPALGNVTQPLRNPFMWLLGTGTGLYLLAQIGITSFVVLFLHEHRHVSREAAGAVLAVIYLLAVAARIGSGRISDRLGSRLRPLRVIGLALTLCTAAVAVAVDAPLALVVPLFVVAGVLSMSWNGLAYAAAAEAAGTARTGAALGFQQTLLGVVVAGAPPAIAAIASQSWQAAFLVAAAGPAFGFLILRGLREPVRGRRRARTLGTSASLPAAHRTPD
jgi:sugar phosphate permease